MDDFMSNLCVGLGSIESTTSQPASIDNTSIGTNDITITVDNSITPFKALLEYSSIRISEELWTQRLQDERYTGKLVKATYHQNKIPPFGPPGNPIYNPKSSTIAIDSLRVIFIEKMKEGDGVEF